MDTNTAPKPTFLQKVVLDKASKAQAKAAKRGVHPFYKTYSRKDLALLEAHGWKVHSHTPPSYGAPESWLLTRSQ